MKDAFGIPLLLYTSIANPLPPPKDSDTQEVFFRNDNGFAKIYPLTHLAVHSFIMRKIFLGLSRKISLTTHITWSFLS